MPKNNQEIADMIAALGNSIQKLWLGTSLDSVLWAKNENASKNICPILLVNENSWTMGSCDQNFNYICEKTVKQYKNVVRWMELIKGKEYAQLQPFNGFDWIEANHTCYHVSFCTISIFLVSGKYL